MSDLGENAQPLPLLSLASRATATRAGVCRVSSASGPERLLLLRRTVLYVCFPGRGAEAHPVAALPLLGARVSADGERVSLQLPDRQKAAFVFPNASKAKNWRNALSKSAANPPRGYNKLCVGHISRGPSTLYWRESAARVQTWPKGSSGWLEPGGAASARPRR